MLLDGGSGPSELWDEAYGFLAQMYEIGVLDHLDLMRYGSNYRYEKNIVFWTSRSKKKEVLWKHIGVLAKDINDRQKILERIIMRAENSHIYNIADKISTVTTITLRRGKTLTDGAVQLINERLLYMKGAQRLLFTQCIFKPMHNLCLVPIMPRTIAKYTRSLKFHGVSYFSALASTYFKASGRAEAVRFVQLFSPEASMALCTSDLVMFIHS
ncbi:hypothetical protein CHS0354_028014 [Potamilus streckersoni]|uniref:Uncharacterized protein n=1 Tax=Potamilus streckersoni TaxID=2493646 RepID=A0AAE0RM80_9BIVA|nr:hypothetical protein CHS0354_028014 [Potamilus streckersoni]